MSKQTFFISDDIAYNNSVQQFYWTNDFLKEITSGSQVVSLKNPVGNLSYYILKEKMAAPQLLLTSSADESNETGLSNSTFRSQDAKRLIRIRNMNFKFIEEKKRVSLSVQQKEEVDKTWAGFYDLANLPFEKLAVEVTSDNVLKLKLAFRDDYLLIVSKAFHQSQDMEENSVVFSFFQNRKRIAANVLPISKLVEGFKEFFEV